MRDWRHNNNVHYFGSCGAYDVHLANLYFHAIYVFYVGDMGGFGMLTKLQLACFALYVGVIYHILSFRKEYFSSLCFFAIIPMPYSRVKGVYKFNY